MFLSVPAPWGLQGLGEENWSGGHHAGVKAGVVFVGRDWNEGVAAKMDGAIALGLGSVLGSPEYLQLSAQVSELLLELALGACGIVVDSLS